MIFNFEVSQVFRHLHNFVSFSLNFLFVLDFNLTSKMRVIIENFHSMFRKKTRPPAYNFEVSHVFRHLHNFSNFS